MHIEFNLKKNLQTHLKHYSTQETSSKSKQHSSLIKSKILQQKQQLNTQWLKNEDTQTKSKQNPAEIKETYKTPEKAKFAAETKKKASKTREIKKHTNIEDGSKMNCMRLKRGQG